MENQNGNLKVLIQKYTACGKDEFFIESISFHDGAAWNVVFEGVQGQEFCTSFINSGAQTCEWSSKGTEKTIKLACRNEFWEAEEEITLGDTITRKHKYRFLSDGEGFINPGFMVHHEAELKYTYPLQVYQKPLEGLAKICCDSAWAVPFPCHILSGKQRVAVYGIDRNNGAGTLDFQPLNHQNYARLGSYYPDTNDVPDAHYANRPLGICRFQKGQIIELTEFIIIKKISGPEPPLFEAEKLAASLLLKTPLQNPDWVKLADNAADFFNRGSLWEPNAFGQTTGFFRNMWTYINGAVPQKDTHLDLGWGEGYSVLTLNALYLHWKRTKNPKCLTYINEITKGIGYFKRNPKEDGVYYDRLNLPSTKTLLNEYIDGPSDFMGFKRIWSHSLGNIGYQLLNLYKTSADYPDEKIRSEWQKTGFSIGAFFAAQQNESGDIQDGFLEDNAEANITHYRIPARAVVCGLWTLMAEMTGDSSYIQRATKLASFLSGEIQRYDFYGQMLDTHYFDNADDNYWDSENACYALLGLTELYLATSDEKINRLCQASAAYFFSWIYFYNLPHGYRGWTRGGTTCRMPDYPLLYVGAGALAFIPLLRLAERTGEKFYRQMAEEIIGCIARYQWDCPDKPWDGGTVHALDQNTGEHWGPDRLGQVDSGMTSGMSLANLEYWIAKNHQ